MSNILKRILIYLESIYKLIVPIFNNIVLSYLESIYELLIYIFLSPLSPHERLLSNFDNEEEYKRYKKEYIIHSKDFGITNKSFIFTKDDGRIIKMEIDE